jgi:hypothetical protein
MSTNPLASLQAPRRSRRTALAALLPLLAAVAPAQAATFCVSTGPQLATAMSTAAGNGVDDEIRIVAGALSGTSQLNGNPRWYYRAGQNDLDRALTVSGGWSSGNNCASQTSSDPQDTVLDAAYTGAAVDIGASGSDILEGDIVVRNLTITRGLSTTSGTASNLRFSALGGINASLLLENLIVIAGSNAAPNSNTAAVTLSGAGSVKLRNLVVHDNQSPGSGSFGGLSVVVSGAAVGYVSNLSIFDNQSTQAAAGLYATGAITLSNNAVADNTSTAATSYQFYSASAGQLTLRNNHFGTKSLVGGAFSETGTTLGDPKWSGIGNVRVPNSNSPLRDSGTNSPTGGLAATDVLGKPRIANGTVDRGAVESEPVLDVGPTIIALSPANNSTSSFTGGNVGDFVYLDVSFSTTGGKNLGSTDLVCTVSAGTVKIAFGGSQSVVNGQTPGILRLYFQLTTSSQSGTVKCTGSPQNGTPSTLTYNFTAPAATLIGPDVTATAPEEGSTTTLYGAFAGEVLRQSLGFSAVGGSNGASTAIDCFEAAGPVVITADKAQAVATGGTPKPVSLAFEVQNAVQSAEVRCTVTRQGVAGSTLMRFYFTVTPSAMLFDDGFEN